LTLSSNGIISGTPVAIGIYTGSVNADNGLQHDSTQNFTITVSSTFSTWASYEGLSGTEALPTAIVSPDGLTNLTKYALGLSPFVSYGSGSPGLPDAQWQTVSGSNYLTLSFDIAATDVTYNVQASSNLTGTWTTIHTFPNGGAVSGSVMVQDTEAVGTTPMRFMRLLITNP
jgi:hypothetical protein